MQVIRPGLLVALRTRVQGGVTYARRDLEETENTKTWETTRVMADVAEHAAANRVRGAARSAIVGVCAKTVFGLLCPSAREAEFDAACARARQVAGAFNLRGITCKVFVDVLKGRIAENDQEAAAAIVREMAGLIADLREGVGNLDPVAIRQAADRARQTAAMLGEEQQRVVGAAVKAARKAARAIVRRIDKAGEAVADVMRDLDLSAVDTARITFLDLADKLLPEAEAGLPGDPEAGMLPAVEAQRFADLPLEAETEPPVAALPGLRLVDEEVS